MFSTAFEFQEMIMFSISGFFPKMLDAGTDEQVHERREVRNHPRQSKQLPVLSTEKMQNGRHVKRR